MSLAVQALPKRNKTTPAPHTSTVAMEIRPATPDDFPQMLAIFRKVLTTGDTYVLEADTSVGEAYDYWFGPQIETWVALENGRVVGMYRLIANQKGRGSHVANMSIMVDPDVRGRGVGLAVGRHSLAQAKKNGFLAMQFNMVVSTNTHAVALWKKLGFDVVGTLPGAFRQARHGFVDAYVMWRSL